MIIEAQPMCVWGFSKLIGRIVPTGLLRTMSKIIEYYIGFHLYFEERQIFICASLLLLVVTWVAGLFSCRKAVDLCGCSCPLPVQLTMYIIFINGVHYICEKLKV